MADDNAEKMRKALSAMLDALGPTAAPAQPVAPVAPAAPQVAAPLSAAGPAPASDVADVKSLFAQLDGLHKKKHDWTTCKNCRSAFVEAVNERQGTKSHAEDRGDRLEIDLPDEDEEES